MSNIDIPAHSALTNTLDELLATARPRLLRLAQQQGVSPDAADDVVQETLVEAWRHLEHLHSPERFDAWLNGICRNVSLRWSRTYALTKQRQESLLDQVGVEQDNSRDDVELDILDPFALDPAEELSRQDLATLLDRAMGYLPATTRKALELYYLAEIPQNETALQLGLTINALEVRLHRARRQLRQVLSNELRDDAESFGMAIDKDATQGWRKTGMWCLMCGQHQMLGIFEPLANRTIDLRMRCPCCSQLENVDIVNTCGTVQLGTLRSFRPAMKRVMAEAPQLYRQAIAQHLVNCPACCGRAAVLGVEQHTMPFPFHNRFYIVINCPTDGTILAGIISVCFDHSTVQQFLIKHPRCIFGPEQLIERQGQNVIQVQLLDISSTSMLVLFVSPRTLEIVDIC
jgi:RNA polymerase sigma-70 factor (ECF subfamily)